MDYPKEEIYSFSGFEFYFVALRNSGLQMQCSHVTGDSTIFQGNLNSSMAFKISLLENRKKEILWAGFCHSLRPLCDHVYYNPNHNILIGFRFGNPQGNPLSVLFWKMPLYAGQIQEAPFFLFFKFSSGRVPDILSKNDKVLLKKELNKFLLPELEKLQGKRK